MPPDVFFELSPEQIIQALVNQGYSQKEAEKEVEQFMEWKEKTAVPQTFSDDPVPFEEQAEKAPQDYKGFFGAVARLKQRGNTEENAGSSLTRDDEVG